MRKILSTIAIVAASAAYAQVGISGDVADTPQATLDVKAINDGTNPDGLLIPRINESYAESMPTPEISTLVYVTDGTDAAASRTAQVDAPGFYYFDAVEWVKLGGGAAAEPAKTIKVVSAITASEWDNDQYALVQTSTAAVQLPDPTSNENRILSVVNNAGTTINYGAIAPVANTSVRAGKGQVIMSDGQDWYVIGGF